uniref:FAD dependent oxidoreductase domain-containing protein n=1 Tax=Coccolithus braarudii TaxID=221442 RepID=A0A7S0LDJ3_9EUKA
MLGLLPTAAALVAGMPRVSMVGRTQIQMRGVTQGEVHGEGGAYVGGYWVPMDECADKFNIKGGSNEKTARIPCPRSSTRHSAAKPDGSYDVVIIGAGCIGAAVARELSKTTASVLMIEAADDVCQGATKGNSGIVHAGFDDTPGSTRAKLCWKGNQMFPALDEELHFGYQLTGSLVVARSAEEELFLDELMARGLTNGVENLRIVRGAELRKMEPNLDPAATAALLSPDAGTLIPYEYNIALAENAADNGVEVRIRRMVTSIGKAKDGSFEVHADHWEPQDYVASQKGPGGLRGAWKRLAGGKEDEPTESLGEYEGGGPGEGGPWQDYPALVKGEQKVTVADMKVGGSGSMRAMDGVVVEKETIRATYIVNCAGGYSDKIAAMLGDESFTIKPRMGEYVLLKKSSGGACNHILFPCPGPYGKGILVQKTLWGNLILGPTARDQHEWADPDVDPDSKEEILNKVLSSCKRLVPGFDVSDAFHSFAGARAKSSRGDWIIERSAAETNLIHAAGIDSPGIAGSPAIALEVVELLQQAGFSAPADPDFNPKRAAIITPKSGDDGLVYTPDTKTELNSAGVSAAENVVCKCEKVTEAEIVEACRRSLPLDSTQTMRKRTRAGMGGCQGKPWNYGCECRVAQVIAREAELAPPVVGRRPWAATSQFDRRWLTDDDKTKLNELAKVPEEI